MRGQAAAMSILSSSSSSAATLFHRRVVASTCLRPSSSSSSRLFPLLSRCLSNWNNRSSPLRSVPAIKLQVAEIGGRRRWCSTRATNVSDPGSIDSSMILSMQTKIKEELEADSVLVKDAYGDGRHVTITVVSKLFEGKTAVNRQRMVYKAIWEELQTTVHAVDHMTTLTPDESQSQSDPPNL